MEIGDGDRISAAEAGQERCVRQLVSLERLVEVRAEGVRPRVAATAVLGAAVRPAAAFARGRGARRLRIALADRFLELGHNCLHSSKDVDQR